MNIVCLDMEGVLVPEIWIACCTSDEFWEVFWMFCLSCFKSEELFSSSSFKFWLVDDKIWIWRFSFFNSALIPWAKPFFCLFSTSGILIHTFTIILFPYELYVFCRICNIFSSLVYQDHFSYSFFCHNFFVDILYKLVLSYLSFLTIYFTF